MTAQTQENLIRKQFLVSKSNVRKLEQVASKQGKSAAQIVRQAIDAYDPQAADTIDSSELMSLVSTKLKEAIKSTQKANKKVAVTLKKLEGGH